MKKICFVMMFLLIVVSVFGEQYSERGLGFSAGTVSGIGFSYRQYVKDFGYQITVGITASDDKKPNFSDTISEYGLSGNTITKSKKGWELDGSIGLMLIKTLKDYEHSKFYCFVGGSVRLDRKKVYSRVYDASNRATYYLTDIETSKTVNDDVYYFGPGIGVDLELSKHASFALEWPLTISSEKKIVMYIPQCSLTFKF